MGVKNIPFWSIYCCKRGGRLCLTCGLGSHYARYFQSNLLWRTRTTTRHLLMYYGLQTGPGHHGDDEYEYEIHHFEKFHDESGSLFPLPHLFQDPTVRYADRCDQ